MEPSDIAALIILAPFMVGLLVTMGMFLYYQFRLAWIYTQGIPDKIMTICLFIPMAAVLLGVIIYPLFMIFKNILGN